MTVNLPDKTPCPCGSSKPYATCCNPFHTGEKKPATAEQLMRSRYCAFALSNGFYLNDTLAVEKRDGFDPDSVGDDDVVWTKLDIVECTDGGILDQSGIVEFIAHFRENGRDHQLHERSSFERRDGKWYYVSGIFPQPEAGMHHVSPVPVTGNANVGRNDPCPCGSGKKFKKCCG